MKLTAVLTAAVVATCLPGVDSFALDAGTPVVVTPLTTTAVTVDGMPIVLPRKDVQVVVSIYDIASGASLPVHKHPYPRYAYVLAGTLQVTKVETGETFTYEPGDFVVEMVDEWHKGASVGSGPVKLLVIDQVEKGAQNTILRQ